MTFNLTANPTQTKANNQSFFLQTSSFVALIAMACVFFDNKKRQRSSLVAVHVYPPKISKTSKLGKQKWGEITQVRHQCKNYTFKELIQREPKLSLDNRFGFISAGKKQNLEVSTSIIIYATGQKNRCTKAVRCRQDYFIYFAFSQNQGFQLRSI